MAVQILNLEQDPDEVIQIINAAFDGTTQTDLKAGESINVTTMINNNLITDIFDGIIVKNANNATNAINAENANSALNSTRLENKHFVLVKDGQVTLDIIGRSDSVVSVLLKDGGQHNLYFYSCYSNVTVNRYFVENGVYCVIQQKQNGTKDVLVMGNNTSSSRTVYYQVFSWE